MASAGSSLHQPLLPQIDRKEQRPEQQQAVRDNFWPCTFNLAKAITGAGMMAIPRAFLQIGWLPGTLMLAGVAGLTYYTLAVLVRGATATRATTYAQLVLVTTGRGLMRLLQLAVLLFCFGFSVAYLVVIRDILLGTPPDCNGLLCEAFGPAALIDARLLIIVVALLVCAPLLLLRSMERLASINMLGVAATVLLAAASAALAAVAAARGTAYTIPMLPQWSLLGPTPGQQLEALTDVLPVILACYVAHQSLFPLMPVLAPYSQARMLKVVALALTIAGCIFLALALGCATAFGLATAPDVLDNFSVQGLAPLLGGPAAVALSWAVRGSYLLCILATLLLYMHPLRGCLAEMLWPEAPCVHVDAVAAFEGWGGAEQAPLEQAAAAARPGDATGVGGAGAAHRTTGPLAGAHGVVVEGLGRVGAARKAARSAAGGGCSTGGGGGPSGGRQEQPSAAEQPGEQAGAAVRRPAAATTAAAAAAGTPASRPRAVWQQLEQANYHALTYGLLAAMVLAAVLVSNIYEVLSAVGDLASTVQAFIVPGIVAIALLRATQRAVTRAAAGVAAASPSFVDTEAGGAAAAAMAPAGACKPGRFPWLPPLTHVLQAAAPVLVVLLGVALFSNGVVDRMVAFV